MPGIGACLPLSRAYDDKQFLVARRNMRVNAVGIMPRFGAERRLPTAQLLSVVALALANRCKGSLPRTGKYRFRIRSICTFAEL